MRNILLTGVGGQGTVLAAKVLAQAARDKGWHVRTAETIGMAQRGGSVVSHVRMGDDDAAASPLVPQASAHLVIAFEPAEAFRVLPYVARDGSVVTATSPVQPVTAALSGASYRTEPILEALRARLGSDHVVAVDDAALLARVGNARTLNTVLVATAVARGFVPLSVDDLKQAVAACVKPRFVDVNLKAIDLAVAACR